MTRAHFSTYATDNLGNVIPGVTVTVREPDTTTAISETIYATDDTVGDAEKGNPFTSDADGKITLWLASPKVVDLLVTKTGYDPQTLRATVHNLTASTLTVLNNGDSFAQRSGLDFSTAFVVSDDEAEDATLVTVDYGETADLVDVAFGDVADGGSSVELARADHQHAAPANPVTAHEVTYDHSDIAASDTAITNHLADASDAHDASAISILDSGGDFTATDVEGALAELQSDAETHAANASAHHADTPPGVIAAYVAASAPTGWLLCDGTAVSRSTYSALFAIIGETYGAGNGSTTFNVPNLEQRFPLGKADSGTGATLGATGGAIDHTHSTPSGTSGSEAAHTHTFSDTSDGPSSAPSNMTAGGSTSYAGAAHNHDVSGTTGAGSSHSHSTPSGTSGTANAPFLVVNYIIKT